MFFAGLIGVAWETFAEHVDRPWLLGVFAAMLGLDVLSDSLVIRPRNKNGDGE